MEVKRCLGIDCGHRVPNHNSHCANLHGHRYEIALFAEATSLQKEGSSEGMIVDFGCLKKALENVIKAQFDHRTALWRNDSKLLCLVDDTNLLNALAHSHQNFKLGNITKQYFDFIFADDDIDFVSVPGYMGPIVVMRHVPTVENMASAWLRSLIKLVELPEDVSFSRIVVYETPNGACEIKASELKPLEHLAQQVYDYEL